MFSEFMHDFKDVKLGEIPVYKFEIKNPYNETIRIRSIHSSCGCTVVSATKNALKTNEAGEIVCKFNTPAVGTGFKRATVTVRFDRPFVGEAQLIVQGNIVGNIQVNPPSIEFGQVLENELPVKQIDLTSMGNPNLRVVDVKSTFGHIAVQLQQTQRSNGGVSYRIFTRLKESVPKGFSQGELYVVVEEGRGPDGTAKLKNVPIKFNAQVVSALQVSPQVLSLGPLAPGEETTKKVFLKSSKPFAIRDVRCHSDAFRVKADSKAKKVHIVEVTYTGESKPGTHECDLSFFVEYPDAANGNGKASKNTLKAVVQIVQK